MKSIKEFIKKIAFRYLKLGAPKYNFNIEPIQLTFLVNEIERLKDINGSICEVGVARGLTTMFLAEHISNQSIEEKNKYYAIDTFDSFVKSDLEFEVKNRGKVLSDLKGFEYNSIDVWRKNFSEFTFINLIQADCSKFDFNSIGPIKVTLLDVDLYLPTKKALESSFKATVKGGVIVVDDVREDNAYDGAHQAYTEFCKDNNMKPKIIGNKCGIIYKD
jgi:predicted O-methyltransferase YrrM